ncbi:hypothetical protein [Haloferax volcanii]|uniref:hypothetical protein n=1 Tax=Haloferax volcanii TaxID=2246 RepID=UPI00349F8620
MSDDDNLLDPADLAPWGLIAAFTVAVIYILFGAAYTMFDTQAISAVSAFGAGVSAMVSVFLVVIYLKQTEILGKHAQIMETQSDLMELQYVPKINTTGDPSFNEDAVKLSVENMGSGTATELQLLTRIEFEGSSDYDSPLTGTVDLVSTSGAGHGKQSLDGNDTGEFEADACFDIVSLSGSERSRRFSNIIANLAGEVERIRVSMYIDVAGQAGNPNSTSILSEEAFYTSLEGLDDFTLEECYRVSTPA